MSQPSRLACTPALLSERDAAHYLGISPSKLRSLGLPRRKLDGRRLYDRVDLDAYVSTLPYDTESDQACRDADRAFGCAI